MSSRATEPIEGKRLAAEPERGDAPTGRRRRASRWRGARPRGRGRRPSCRQPSSATRIRLRPPASTTISMRRAPASSAFSTSSFTAAAGRSMTSPAAMRSISTGSRRRTGITQRSAAGARPSTPAHSDGGSECRLERSGPGRTGTGRRGGQGQPRHAGPADTVPQLGLRRRQKAFALRLLAGRLAGPPDGFALLARSPLTGFSYSDRRFISRKMPSR